MDDEERKRRGRILAAVLLAGVSVSLTLLLSLQSPPGDLTPGAATDSARQAAQPPLPYIPEPSAYEGLMDGDRAGAAPPREAAPGPAAWAPQPESPATPAGAAPNAADADARELAAAGVPFDAAGLARLGGQKGLLSALVTRLLDNPRVLKAVLDNKLVVDAVMRREISRRNCADAGALASVLSDPASPQVARLLPVVQQALARPAAAAAMVNTELGRRLMDCPSVSAMTANPSLLMSVAMSNPAALQVLSNPNLAGALASNPKAAGMLAGVQSSIGAGAAAPRPSP